MIDIIKLEFCFVTGYSFYIVEKKKKNENGLFSFNVIRTFGLSKSI